MSWQLIRGNAPKPDIDIKRCLRLDGVNDYLTLGSSTFYNVGYGQFSYFISFMLGTPMESGRATIFRTNSGNGDRFTIGLDTSKRLYIAFVEGTLTSVVYFGSVIELGVWNQLAIVRTGTNTDFSNQPGWDDSIRNPQTYKAYLNGVNLPISELENVPELGLPIDLDSTEPKLIGGTPLGRVLHVYFNSFGIWNTALTEEEIQIINSGAVYDYMSKGIFQFDGNTNDSSSVGGIMTLVNSATPSHVTYPFKDGVLFFDKGISDQIREFIYPEEVVITKIWKQNNYNGFQYSFDGVSWFSTPTGTYIDVYIIVPPSTILYIKDSISRINYNFLHLEFQ